MNTIPDVQVGNDEPLYNIGAVARMTNISMPTLRAWERRYNFPESRRTSGGHRLYSENDVLSLRWVKARIDDGMQTSQAILALHHQEIQGKVARPETQEIWSTERRVQSVTHLSAFQERLFDVLTHRDEGSADVILGEALPLTSPEDLILEVIIPTFTRIGEAWHDGLISVATEHLATNYLRQRLLMWLMSGPPPHPVKPIVLACAPNEWHEGSLLALAALLRRSRWPVAYLGQSVPLKDLSSFIRDNQPELVILVAMTESSAAELVQWPQYMPEVAKSGHPVIAFGGRVFTYQPEWRMRMSGTYLGSDLSEGMKNVEKIINQ